MFGPRSYHPLMRRKGVPAREAWRRTATPWLVSVLALGACGVPFESATLTQPATAASPNLLLAVARVAVSEDMRTAGVNGGSALVVIVDVTNRSAQPFKVSPAQAELLMVVDEGHPEATLSLVPAGGGEGQAPSSVDEDLSVADVVVPPGQTRAMWILFREYRFPSSDVARRVTFSLPGTDGKRLSLVLADPARGTLRWRAPAPSSAWMWGANSISLYGAHLTGSGISLEFMRVARLGPVNWDVAISSLLLVQRFGALSSPTSAFTGSGLSAHLSWPFATWGPWQLPQQLGLYGGGRADLLIATPAREDPNNMEPLQTYGAFAAEAGVELGGGAVLPVPTPFPRATDGRPLPRWMIRVGYTEWWVAGGTSPGMNIDVRFTFD
jgi:hypothetical protein